MARKVFEEMLVVVVVLLCFFDSVQVYGDAGTATSYDPPYQQSAHCPGYDHDRLPGNGLFAAAGNAESNLVNIKHIRK
ncbi:EG45-like domain containing protein [Canna indica]|uniref:EG45-like domain containing protein n=1 Tax=Canna indica TaxID=4628 RepID=A0AAQ3QDZ5_9LILI|nr:EG45-like domain containing protein [Canna indica]